SRDGGNRAGGYRPRGGARHPAARCARGPSGVRCFGDVQRFRPHVAVDAGGWEGGRGARRSRPRSRQGGVRRRWRERSRGQACRRSLHRLRRSSHAPPSQRECGCLPVRPQAGRGSGVSRMNAEQECRFFIPGPTWVRPEILRAMGRPMIGHRSAEFKQLFRGIVDDLKPLFATRQHTFVATCSGTGLMEASLVNCVPRRVLVTTCGAFSERWAAIAESLGLEVDRLDVEWGMAVDPEMLADHLASHRAHYDAVTITHNETSTGVTNDLAALARVIHEESPGTLVLVDAVSSVAGIPVLFDEWGLDVCFASVQKGVALPPGVTLFAVSEQAMQRVEK